MGADLDGGQAAVLGCEENSLTALKRRSFSDALVAACGKYLSLIHIFQRPSITPEMISAAVTQSAAGMDGVQKEALDKFGQALTEFLQSTLDHAQEKHNASPEQ